MRRAILLALALQLGSSCVAASDFNPLGFYIAGSAGRSDVRTSLPAVESAGEFAQSSTGWKAALGMRPIPLLAAEVEYIDFGHPASSTNLVNPPSSTNPFNFGFHNNVLQRAQSVSALLFAPIPLPVIDLYARAGIARLHSSGNGSFQCPPGYLCPFIIYDLRFNRTDTDFQYGAGLQLKLSSLAVRLEYERINDRRGDPDLLSAGLAWKF